MIANPRITWMRYIIGDAGNIIRLYYAVKTASEVQSDNLEVLCHYYLKMYGSRTIGGRKKRGLNKERSLEPHFSLARELDFLECQSRERWRITFGPGKAFLALWEAANKQPPIALILGQLVRYDRSFLIPLICSLVDSDYDFSQHKFVGLEEIAREAWEEVWLVGERELREKQPPIPQPSQVGERTLRHHAQARIRLLNSTEGLGLNIDKIRRLAEVFYDYQTKDLPNDYYFRIGKAISGHEPREITEHELDQYIIEAFSRLQRMGFASGFGVFAFVNELIFPNSAVDWEVFRSYIRQKKAISTNTSFRPDDFLLSVDKKAIIEGCIDG